MRLKPVKSVNPAILIILFTSLFASQRISGSGLPDNNAIEPFGNEIFSETIHTVMLRSTTWEFSPPVYELGSMQKLELLFDDLSAIPHTFSYTFVHCDAYWRSSALQPQEYLSGIGTGTIQESSPSVNTTYGYFHYRLEFPQEDCMPVLSGNYALLVSDVDDPDRTILTRRFYVVEKSVQITGRIKQPTPGDFKETGQQVELTLNYNNLAMNDPVRDLDVVIRQNGREDNIIHHLKPSFFSQGEIEYADPDEGIFLGGNEFRTLDIKSMKYQTENIAGFDFQNAHYHVFLKPDKSRENKPYFSKSDLNGNFFINQEKAREKHLEADYVFVHFCLEENFPAEDEVFVFGKFADWSCTRANKMEYNAAKSCYEAVVLLKQGLYDYDFAAYNKSKGRADEETFEGSFYETGNDYEIYVYLHDNRSRYDRLIGYLPLKK
jgi:hypothetical protein